MSQCTCEFCTDYRKYIWAVVLECKCGCHTDDGVTGHDALCCEIPNGLKRNNPHPDLEDVVTRTKILKEFHIKHRDPDDEPTNGVVLGERLFGY